MNHEKLHALELSLTIGCKLACDYCPQKLLLDRYYGEDKARKQKLSFEDFKVALDKVQPGATISFCGMSEPFHNEECADMIVYAYEKGYKLCLNTTLVGMTVSDFEKIKNVEFESFILHIPDQERHSKFVITEEYLDLLKMVNEHIHINYYSCHGSVHEEVRELIDQEKYAGISLCDRAGNLDLNYDISVQGKIVCYHGSEEQVGGWTPVMFPDGSLVLCCQDYGMKHILGNLIQQSWSEICEGVEYKKFRNGLKDDSIDILCRTCSEAKAVDTLPAMRLRLLIDYGKTQGESIGGAIENLVQRFVAAEHICVFGLGKLWRDHFYQEYWHEGLGVTLFSDNNPDLQENCINGIPCVKPDELKNYEKLLVVIFVKNGEDIVSQFHDIGIDNCILIGEVYDICNLIGKEQFGKMTV